MHPGFYVLIGVAALLILGFFWGKKLRESRETVFIDFAHLYNLEIHTDDLRMGRMHISGAIDGHPFELKEEVVDFNKDDPTIWTYFRFENTPIDFDFQISCDNWAMKVAKGLGYDDVELGNADFDKKFVCHTKSIEKFSQLFDESHQQKLLDLYAEIQGMLENKSEEGRLEYVHQGTINRQFQMDPLLQMMGFMQILLKKA